jgi:hypothetical protein
MPGDLRRDLPQERTGKCAPVPLEGIRKRHLPECTFRGRHNQKLQYAILAAAAAHSGAEPGLLEEVAWWQTDGFWQCPVRGGRLHPRCAHRAAVPVRQACQELT